MPSAMTLMYPVPVVVVYMVGVVISLVTWRRHSTVSLLALCGFSLLLLSTIVGVGLQFWVASVNEVGYEEVRRAARIVTAFRSLLLSPIAFGFLMAAIFGRRREQVEVWEA